MLRATMEEIMNAVTHGIGAVLAVTGLVVLIVAASVSGGVWHLVSFIVYGLSLVLLYLASTLYHSFRGQKVKHVFKIFDHAAIFLLIAGTYTPFALIPLHGLLGWTIFGIVWGIAVIGIVLKVFFVKRFNVLSTLCYLAMGWFAVIMIKPLLVVMPVEALYWLAGGGILYSVGAIFYLARTLPYSHAVWHLFVLAGSTAHFVAVLRYVLPVAVV